MAASAPDPDGTLDALYAAVPTGFVAARDQASAQAKAAGDRELAASLKALRRPAPSAWMVNALVRDDPEVLEQFLALGAALAEAQASLRGDDLRALSTQRAHVVTSLVTRAEALARQAGVRADSTTTAEVQQTLVAALADPAAADEVRAGRLSAPLSYSGFGVEPGAGAPTAKPISRTTTAPKAEGARTAGEARKVGAAGGARKAEEAQKAEKAAKAARAEAAKEAARRAALLERAETARRTLEQAEEAARKAAAARAELETDLAHVREQLRDVERRSADAALEARRADAAVRAARTAHDHAHQAAASD